MTVQFRLAHMIQTTLFRTPSNQQLYVLLNGDSSTDYVKLVKINYGQIFLARQLHSSTQIQIQLYFIRTRFYTTKPTLY